MENPLSAHTPVITQELNDLLGGIAGIPFGSWAKVAVTGISVDSRQVRDGDLFVALAGQNHHGIDFADDAVRRGAAAVVVPMGSTVPAGTPGIKVSDPRGVLATVAARFHGDPSRELFLFGVTGTNGKSTTAHMVRQILDAAGFPAGIWSTPGVNSGSRQFRPKLTTPEAPELHKFFREVLDFGMRHACIEVSSHSVCQKRVTGVHFDVGAVTNVTPDHLDFHGSFEDYLGTKRRFVESLNCGAICFLNADDTWVARMGERARVRVITYGCSEQADLRACEPKYGPDGTRFVIRATPALADVCPREFSIRTAVLGRHNVYNSLVAVGTGLMAGVPLESIRESLAAFQLPPRRLETKRLGTYTVVNDVAMNEASYEAVLETMKTINLRQLVVVNAVRGNRGAEVNAGIARLLARWNLRLNFAPLIVTTSETHVARYEVDYRVRPLELAAFKEAAAANGLSLSVHDELPDAIKEGVERLEPHGLLLLLGTFGMDDGAVIAEKLLWEKVRNRADDQPRPFLMVGLS